MLVAIAVPGTVQPTSGQRRTDGVVNAHADPTAVRMVLRRAFDLSSSLDATSVPLRRSCTVS